MFARALFMLFVLVCVIAHVGCEGEQGLTGPQGPAGVDGQDGQDGQDGNANVIMFEFGSKTTSAGWFSYLFEASQGLVDSSLVLAYANPSDQDPTAWYPVPGLGSGGNYVTRSFWWQINSNPSEYTYEVRLRTPDGSVAYTASVTFTKYKIILAPASSITMGTMLGTLDLSDYRSVRKYFDLSD